MWKKAGYERGGYWASLHIAGRSGGVIKRFGLDHWDNMDDPNRDFNASAKRAQKIRDVFIKSENKKIEQASRAAQDPELLIVTKGGMTTHIRDKIINLFGQDSVIVRDRATGQDLYKVDGV